jgi:hypothetical protein
MKNSEELKNFKKYVYTMIMRNKGKDLKSVYNYGYSLKLTDEEISFCLSELNF